ncbi:MAG TPA: ABC transporter substrate-binding protein [Actinocrinis sp.]|jgi:peptide/nickel transport system substrate-binding protein
MRQKKLIAGAAIAAAIGLTVTACGKSSNSSGGSNSSYNASLTSVVNPSSSTTGNVVLEDAASLQSTDAGNTYDATDWDVSRLWARTMLAYSESPGTASNKVVGDLATGPGTHNAANTVWTYTIRNDAKFQDGSTITAADVAYAIKRSNWGHAILSNGPTYFAEYVDNTNNYAGPYVDKNPNDGPSGIKVVNATTLEFTLNQPVADFDYLMTLPDTAPVEPAKDTGLTYANHIVSSAAYEIQSYTPNKTVVLVPNPNFVTASDPNGLHKVHASQVTIKLGLSQTTIDQDILHGRAQGDIGGVGTDASDQGIVLDNPQNKKYSSDPTNGFLNYLSINTQLEPFDNLNCRIAVEYAINKTQVQSVMGGSVGAGPIANTVLPPTVEGYAPADVWSTAGNDGNATKAEQYLNTCKQQETTAGKWTSGSLTITIGAYSDQPKTVDAANAEVQELNAVGFNASSKPTPFANWGSNAGSFSFVTTNHMALVNAAWGADFPDGNGFFQYVLGSAGVSMTGSSSNFSYFDNKTFDGDLTTALQASDVTTRNADYAKADQYAMSQAVMVPLSDQAALDIYSTNATNVYFMAAYGMYDFASMGAS